VLVDDLSRLSRDLWDMGQIVFGDLSSANIRVVDLMTGISSDSPQARQMFAAMGMGNDFFLQVVKNETHRGLEGRAIKGFWTGGRVYGYRTISEPSPTDPEHPRKVSVIDDGEAQVVRTVFRLYLDGFGFKEIASKLNEQGVPAPYDKLVNKKGGKGWPHTTIRNMLSQERYVGRWVWNKRKHVRVSGNKSRRSVARPSDEHVVKECPELAIVPADVWTAVQAKIGTRKKNNGGREPGTGKNVLLFGGLLKCSVCGNSVGVTGQRKKAGVTYNHVGCNTHKSRGSAMCSNGQSVSERKVNAAILRAIEGIVQEPERLHQFAQKFVTKVVAERDR
jgi:hypothetical protein